MANWCGECRSNYFKVKDIEAFKTFLEKYPAKFIQWDNDPTYVGFLSDDENGATPVRYKEESENPQIEDNMVSIYDEISEHLQENEICIIMEAGAEKLRYISGFAIAIHSSGKTTQVSLNDIYEKAKQEFPNGSALLAEY